MMMRLKFIFLFISFPFCGALFGQNNPVEEVSFDLAKNIFFTDEKIWVNAEVKFGEDSPNSKLLYFEILDQEHRSWGLVKLPLRDGKLSNFIEIPEQVPSGNYLLRSFTRISPNLDLDKGISHQLITILNPQIPPQLGEINKVEPINSSTFAPVEVKAGQLSKGQSARIDLKLPAEQIKSISLSIANPYLSINQPEIFSSEIYESFDPGVFLPELFGHIIYAKVSQSPVDTLRTYFLSAHGEKSALFTDRADTSGDLFFDLGGFKYWDYILIQDALGESMAGVEIQSPAPKTSFKPDFKIPELRISTEQEAFLKGLKKASAITPYYTEIYQQEEFPVVTGFVADQVYELDEYLRFETFETTIREFVLNVFIRRNDKKKEFRILNVPEDYLFDQNPLIMIDALPVFDSDALAGYNPKLFSKVEVLNRTFFLNDQEYDGALSISSYDNDFGLFPIPNEVLYLDYPGETPLVELGKPIYLKEIEQEKIPDFRTVLFWYSTKSQDPSLSEQFEFQSSEIAGDFELKVTYLEGDAIKQWTTIIKVED